MVQPAGQGQGGAKEKLVRRRGLGRLRCTEHTRVTLAAAPHTTKLRRPGRGRAGRTLPNRKYGADCTFPCKMRAAHVSAAVRFLTCFGCSGKQEGSPMPAPPLDEQSVHSVLGARPPTLVLGFSVQRNLL